MKEHRDTDIRICALIALSFFWTGCGYLSWFYHLTDFYSASMADMLSEVVGYLFQALGLAMFALFKRRPSSQAVKTEQFALISGAGLLLDLLASLSPSGPVSLVFGYGMNVVFGLIAGIYLTVLAEYASARRAGLIFGAGYGIGSILSYLLSLPGKSNFLTSPYVFILYALICAAAAPIFSRIIRDRDTTISGAGRHAAGSEDRAALLKYLLLPGLTVILLSCVKSGGFYFPAADLGDHNVSLELSRSFYAAGLIAAGLLNDRRRSAGAVLCVAALIFPFCSIIAGSHIGINYLIWIAGYIFFGFYSVFRIILFTDISKKSPALAWLSCAGLMFGRIGDAAGAAGGIILGEEPIALITLMAVLFVICIFMFFQLYQIMYMHSSAEPDYVLKFASRYELSQRETELMRLILGSKTNKEIAEHLFISENTVKFHVRNLLRKTDCKNRSELLSLYDSFRSPQ